MQEIVTGLLTLLHLVKNLILQRVIVDKGYFQEGLRRDFRQLCEIEEIPARIRFSGAHECAPYKTLAQQPYGRQVRMNVHPTKTCRVAIYGDLHTRRIQTQNKSPTIIPITLPRYVNNLNSLRKRHEI